MGKATTVLLNTLVAPLYNMLSPEQMAQSMIKRMQIPERFEPQLIEDSRHINARVVRSMHNMLNDIRSPRANQVPLLVLVGEHENKLAKKSAQKLLAHYSVQHRSGRSRCRTCLELCAARAIRRSDSAMGKGRLSIRRLYLRMAPEARSGANHHEEGKRRCGEVKSG